MVIDKITLKGSGSNAVSPPTVGNPLRPQLIVTGDESAGSPVGSKWQLPPKEGEREEAFTTFLRKYYFPMLARFPKTIVVIHALLFLISVAYGPRFFGAVRSTLDLPKNTPCETASNAFQASFPDAVKFPPIFIVYHHLSGPALTSVNSSTVAISHSLAQIVAQHPGTVASVSGYWEDISTPGLSLFAAGAVSPNGLTMRETISFTKQATQEEAYALVNILLPWSDAQSNDEVKVYCTGMFSLFYESSAASSSNYEKIDSIVIPVSLVILGFSITSYRHIFVVLIELGYTLLLAFSILLPIAAVFDISPIVLTVIMSMGIAVTFDYNLFLLNRFKEERRNRQNTKEDAVFKTLASAGHVIALSGVTLLVSILLLGMFDNNFLQSMAIACPITVFCSILVNLHLTPPLLLSFECFSHFDAFPYFWPHASCCCIIPPGDANEVFIGRETLKSSRRLNSASPHPAYGANSSDNLRFPLSPGANASAAATDDNSVEISLTAPRKKGRTFWFKIAYATTSCPFVVLGISLLTSIFFSFEFAQSVATSDMTMFYVQGSNSLDGLNQMNQDFNAGAIDPYTILVDTNVVNGVMSSDYFAIENNLIQTLINTESSFMDAKSVTALSFVGGNDISFPLASAFLNPLSAEYNTPFAYEYRLVTANLVNQNKTSSLISIQTIIAPDSQAIVPFITGVRKTLSSLNANSGNPTFPVTAYLLGAYTVNYDSQNLLFKSVPLSITVTVLVALLFMGISFGSVGLSLRLLFTVFTSLSYTYGWLSMVYTPGNVQTFFQGVTPDLQYSSGVFWIIPVMCFSMLIGLALDYDILLMTRVVEFRRLGWSDRAAVCLAIEKTGGIITSAGVIMSVSFAGQLLPKTIVLNQFGFNIFMGVAYDTFIVRTLLVPAVVTIFGANSNLNWWPTVMPPVKLSHEDELIALNEGKWSPTEGFEAENL